MAKPAPVNGKRFASLVAKLSQGAPPMPGAPPMAAPPMPAITGKARPKYTSKKRHPARGG